MFCVKVVVPFKLRARGEVYELPYGRCLHVVEEDFQGFTVEHDETEERFYVRKDSGRVIVATIDDMANEPIDA
jgi:hypothetical protein